MKKIILCSLLTIICLSIIVGCGKNNPNEYICKKNNIDKYNTINNIPYSLDITYIVNIDDNTKLTDYTIINNYHYEEETSCKNMCEVETNWYKEIMDKGYTGYQAIVNCNCEDKSVENTIKYNVNEVTTLRKDIPNIKDDNTFEIDEWLNNNKKNNFNCK